MSEEVINLRKGDKVAVGFTNITVGLGWEPNEGTGGTFDLDVSAIMIDENRKTNKDFFIFYGNLCGRRISTSSCLTQPHLTGLSSFCSGEAMDVIGRLNGTYELVFFDAQKSHYYQQLNLLIDKGLIGKGTVLLADNVIDRKEECNEFLNWFIENNITHSIIPTECGLLVATL
mgnify:CR=1 FL=1